MSFANRQIPKDVLARYSDMIDLSQYDPCYTAEDLEEFLTAVKKAEKLMDEGARKAAFEEIAKESHALYLGLIMIQSKLPVFPFPADLLAPLHSIFADAAVTGLLACRWLDSQYRIRAYLEAQDLLVRVEDYDWFESRRTCPEPNSDTLGVPLDALELLKLIYSRDPKAKRKAMLAEFRHVRSEQNKRGISETLGLRILRGIEQGFV